VQASGRALASTCPGNAQCWYLSSCWNSNIPQREPGHIPVRKMHFNRMPFCPGDLRLLMQIRNARRFITTGSWGKGWANSVSLKTSIFSSKNEPERAR
jgi:hypothetical protein